MLGLIGRVLFVSYLLLSGYDKITQTQKQATVIHERYAKYVEFHQKTVIPSLRQTLNLKSVDFDGYFQILSNLPSAQNLKQSQLQTTLYLGYFEVISAVIVLLYIPTLPLLLAIYLILNTIVLHNPFLESKPQLVIVQTQHMLMNIMMIGIAMILATNTKSVPKKVVVHNKSKNKTKAKRGM